MTLSKLYVIPNRFVIKEDDYAYMLAVSTDTLVVIDKDLNTVEWIVAGSDLDTVVCGSNSMDDFLDNLQELKNSIKSGIDPIKNFELKCP